ncbi:hypothetical protein B0H13DRAFT_1991071 [Mycena leptocephala]|nr:hypothetical protein B0H13DRAFT_1991071 [Mycena leptocephala]
MKAAISFQPDSAKRVNIDHQIFLIAHCTICVTDHQPNGKKACVSVEEGTSKTYPDLVRIVNCSLYPRWPRPSTLLAEAQHSPMSSPFSLPSASRVFGTAVTKGKGREEEDVTGEAHVFCRGDDGKQSSAWVGSRNPHAWMTPRLHPLFALCLQRMRTSGTKRSAAGAGTRITPAFRTTREADRAPRRRKKSRADAGQEINGDNMRSRPFPVISPTRGPRVGALGRWRGARPPPGSSTLLVRASCVRGPCWVIPARTRRRAYTSIRLLLPPAPRRRAEERAASDGESVARGHVPYMSRS